MVEVDPDEEATSENLLTSVLLLGVEVEVKCCRCCCWGGDDSVEIDLEAEGGDVTTGGDEEEMGVEVRVEVTLEDEELFVVLGRTPL